MKMKIIVFAVAVAILLGSFNVVCFANVKSGNEITAKMLPVTDLAAVSIVENDINQLANVATEPTDNNIDQLAYMIIIIRWPNKK